MVARADNKSVKLHLSTLQGKVQWCCTNIKSPQAESFATLLHFDEAEVQKSMLDPCHSSMPQTALSVLMNAVVRTDANTRVHGGRDDPGQIELTTFCAEHGHGNVVLCVLVFFSSLSSSK